MRLPAKFLLSAALVAACGCAAGGALALVPTSAASAAAAESSYWDAARAPVFYGATKISLQKNALSSFDPLDARFRVFARDFEDGDVAVKLENNTVNPSQAGEYTLHYTAEDSHHNESSLDVKVTVSEQEGKEISVERTVYTVASDWNLRLAGFSRCDTGTRQILGVYLPAGESLQMRVVEGPQLGVAVLNNDAHTESSVNIPAPAPSKEGEEPRITYTTVTNTAGSYAGVPLVTAPVLDKGDDINTTYSIEVKYDADRVHPLNYYYEGDDEAKFKEAWDTSGDICAVIEGQTLVMVVPKGDMEAYKRTDSTGFVFHSYDEHLRYYEKVVDRMDAIIGLSYDPEKPTDQNVRMKYLVKANAHGAGAAYYAGNHVGINNASMGAFFEMNWGGLHELAHGYQGALGNGTMGLGETSNNILGHYIQIDKELYTHDADWLGKLPLTEQNRNKSRLEGKKFTEIEVGDRLYAIVNLFDAVAKEKRLSGGEKVYAGMFSYYREKLNDGTFTTSMPNQDVYALYIAEAYDIDILPYWNAWGLEVREDTRLAVSKAHTKFAVLADLAGEKLDEIVSGQHLELKYAPVSEASLQQYALTGNLTVAAEIDEPLMVEGKELTLERDGRTWTAPFANGSAHFSALPAGSYLVRPPLRYDYDYETHYFTVNAGENAKSIAFSYRPQTDYHPTMLKIRGIYDTVGYYLTLSDENRTGTITLGGANLGNQTSADWANNPDKVHTSVTIRDRAGKIVDERSIKGKEPFAYTPTTIGPIALDYGYTVEVFTHTPDYVRVVSLITGKEIEAYRESETQMRIYEIAREGLVPKFLDGFSAADVLYAAAKDTLLADAREQAEALQSDGTLLHGKLLGHAQKAAFLQSYDRLRAEDRTEFDGLAAMLRGGVPQLTLSQKVVTIAYATDGVDWARYLTATDAEDGEIVLGKGNLRVFTDFDGMHAGTYDVTLAVTDRDGNETRCFVTLVAEQDAPLFEDLRMEEKGGCGSSLAGGSALLCGAALLFGTCLLLRRKHS